MKKSEKLQKWYTRFIGIFYLIFITTLITDLIRNGYGLETWHKLLHIGIGIYAIRLGWFVKNANYKVFCLFNGFLFGAFAITGWINPGFLGIDAFNRLDTILHTIVSGSGLIVGFWKD